MMLLLCLLLIVHWLADFTPLSRPWMLAAKRFGKPIGPIAQHAAIHALLMGIVFALLTLDTRLVLIAILIQFVGHFLIDVGKGRLAGAIAATANPATSWYWIVFGLDQLLHQIVILLIASLVIT